MPAYDVPNAAPEALLIVQRFVNTTDLERDVDWIGTAADLKRWLHEHGHAVSRVTRADHARSLELREALRALLVANNLHRKPDATALEVVNRVARSLRVSMAPESASIEIAPRVRRVDAALADVVAAVLRARVDGTFDRLKACRNCRWAFYDYSRNRRASWCSMRLCGNRLKTRRYRARRA